MVDMKKPEFLEAAVQIPTSGLPTPLGTNWFHFSMSNTDIQMLVGYVDPLRASEFAQARAAGAKSSDKLSPDVSQRLTMSLSGFLYLRAQVNELFQKMQAA